LIAPASAVKSTFERIGTVVWALTTLLAAPTAAAISFVLQVNFTALLALSGMAAWTSCGSAIGVVHRAARRVRRCGRENKE
jgi:hypothetical protein